VPLQAGEACSWKQHFKRGTLARSLWGYLVFLRSVKNDGFTHTRVKPLKAATRKFKKGKVVGTYSERKVKLFLAFLRDDLGIISKPFENEEYQTGFMVATQDVHDALCQREKNGCRYLGWTNLPPAIELGKHHPDSVCFDKGALAGALSGAPSGALAGALLFQKRGTRGGTPEMPQLPLNDTVTAPTEKYALQFGAPNQLNQSKSTESVQTVDYNQEKDNQPQNQLQDQEKQSREEVDLDQSKSGSHDKTKTFREWHDDDTSIENISLGRFDEDKAPMSEKELGVLQDCVDDAAADVGDWPATYRTAAECMDKANGAYKAKLGKNPPPVWMAIFKKLRAEGDTPLPETSDGRPDARTDPKAFRAWFEKL